MEKPEEIGLNIGDEFPIGEIRRRLFVAGSHPWNGVVRDLTAQLEKIYYDTFGFPPVPDGKMK